MTNMTLATSEDISSWSSKSFANGTKSLVWDLKTIILIQSKNNFRS